MTSEESKKRAVDLDLTGGTVVDAIVRDLCDRRGLKHAWDDIDDDVRAEIRGYWLEVVRPRLVDAYDAGRSIGRREFASRVSVEQIKLLERVLTPEQKRTFAKLWETGSYRSERAQSSETRLALAAKAAHAAWNDPSNDDVPGALDAVMAELKAAVDEAPVDAIRFPPSTLAVDLLLRLATAATAYRQAGERKSPYHPTPHEIALTIERERVLSYELSVVRQFIVRVWGEVELGRRSAGLEQELRHSAMLYEHLSALRSMFAGMIEIWRASHSPEVRACADRLEQTMGFLLPGPL